MNKKDFLWLFSIILCGILLFLYFNEIDRYEKMENYYIKKLNDTQVQYDKLLNETVEECDERVDEINKYYQNYYQDWRPLYEWEIIAKNVSESHNYTLRGSNRFNCADFTRELVDRLRAYNYSAFSVCGLYGSTPKSYHAWTIIELPIESISGQVLEPDIYKNYEYRRKCRV